MSGILKMTHRRFGPAFVLLMLCSCPSWASDPVWTKESRKAIYTLAFSPDGKMLATAGQEGQVSLWDVEKRELALKIGNYDGPIISLQFAPKRGELIVAFHQSIDFWNTKTGKKVSSLSNSAGLISAIAISGDGQRLAAGDVNATITLWDLAKGKELGRLAGHENPVTAVAFSPDTKTLLSGSSDFTVCKWDIATQTRAATLKHHTHLVSSIAFSPNGRQFATGSWDATVALWDHKTNKPVKIFRGHDDGVYSVCFAPDGRTLVSGGADSAVCVWDAIRKRLTTSLPGQKEIPISCVAFSPDGSVLASGAGDIFDPDKMGGEIRLWRRQPAK